MALRRYRLVERRYIVDYVMNRIKQRKSVIFNCPLGPTPESLRKMYPDLPPTYFRKWRRYADAVVITTGSLLLIEAKIRDPIAGIGALINYKTLIPQTPELKQYLHLQVVPILVAPIERPDIKALCKANGIQFELYRPDWIIPYLKETGWL